MKKYRYDELTWPEMREAINRQPVVLLPFGTVEDHGYHLPISTDNVMQPMIRVPVFAYAAPRVSVEPPLVLLRTDPEREYTGRRVALQNMAGEEFNILEVATTVDFLKAEQTTRSSAPKGGQYIRVSLKDGVANTAGQGTVIVKTDVPGAEVLEIPVVVAGPKATAQAASAR